MAKVSFEDLTNHSTPSGANMLDTNWQTTAAVGLSVASGGVAGAIMLAAFPAQTLGAGAAIGALAYAGKNRADGKSAFPFMDKKSDKTESKSEPVKDTPVTEAAAA